MKKFLSFILILSFVLSSFSLYALAAKTEQFEDISEDSEYYEAIKWTIDKGFMQGTSDSSFSPDMTFTRAQFATLVSRYDNAELSSYEGDKVFSDVDPDSWYGSCAAWAAQTGIMKGTGNGKFSPDNVITRQEIAILFKNYVDYKGIKLEKLREETRLMDRGSKRTASWAKEAVRFAYKTEIMPLDENDCFHPTERVTRAEAAFFLYSLQGSIGHISEEREKKVIAYYLLGRYGNREEMKDVDVLNLHPVKAHGDGRIDDSGLEAVYQLRNEAEKYNPDLKYCVCIPVNSGADIEQLLDSYADCDEFADKIVNIIKKYDLDGVDFDYEFPTGNVPQKNLHYFLDSIRQRLDALGTGKEYIISMAIAGGSWSFDLFQDLGELQHHLDYMNFMDYDLRSEAPWPTTYNHCAPYDSIYPNASTYSDVVLSLEAGVQREKIILGCGMYTQSWSNVRGNGSVGIYCPAEPNNEAPVYFNVYCSWVNYDLLDDGFSFPISGGYYPHWDDTAKALSFYNPNTKKLLSGDDKRSVEEKSKMVAANNLGGLMFFDYTFTAGASDMTGRIRLFEKVNNWMNSGETEE